MIFVTLVLILAVLFVILNQGGEIASVAFNDDVDSNAAVQQLKIPANSLIVSGGGGTAVKFPDVEGMWIKRIRVVDETAGATGGFFYFKGMLDDRKFYYNKEALVGDLLIHTIEFPDGMFRIPPKAEPVVYCNISGAGSEQHSVIFDVFFPHLPTVPKVVPNGVPIARYGKKTGTLIADTLSGVEDIHTDLEDSMIAFSEDPEREYCLHKIIPAPGLAGVGLLGIRHQNGMFDRLFPPVFANAITCPAYELNYLFPANSPPQTLGCGAVTTATEMAIELGVL